MSLTSQMALAQIDQVRRQLDKAREHFKRSLPPGAVESQPPPAPGMAAPNLPVGCVLTLAAEGAAPFLALVQPDGTLRPVLAAPTPAAPSVPGTSTEPPMSSTTTDAENARTAAEEAAARAWVIDAIQWLQAI